MPVFPSILIGVECAPDGSLSSTTQQAVRTGLWLGRKTAAALTFFSVLDGPAPAAMRALAGLTALARADGIVAQDRHAQGEPWVEIVREAQSQRHHLVVIGAPHFQGLTRALFGSTGTKLLANCPCPVWFAVPGPEPKLRQLVIASDLTPVSVKALDLGIHLAQEVHARAHILHVVDYPLDRWSTGDLDRLTARYHNLVRDSAARALRHQLQEQVGLADPGEVSIHVTGRTPVPDIEILHFLRQHPMDLVVMGTTGRTGISQFLLGNTAEQLLPEAPCSVLVVKAAAEEASEPDAGLLVSTREPGDFG